MRISDGSADVCSSDLASAEVGSCSSTLARRSSPGVSGTSIRIRSSRPGLWPEIRRCPASRPVSRITSISVAAEARSEEHTSELQSLMRISYAVFCLKKKQKLHTYHITEYMEAETYTPSYNMERD